MKLHIVPAANGMHWVQLGMRTFFKQTLALSTLFLMATALYSALSFVPKIGSLLVMVLMPSFTLGFMIAVRACLQTPPQRPAQVLLHTFNALRNSASAMLILGLVYSACVGVMISLTALVDGGTFFDLYLLGNPVPPEVAETPAFSQAVTLFGLLSLPLSLAFWHAPALVHWHQFPPLKAMFFSFMACLRNWKAFGVYALSLMAMMLVIAMVASVFSVLLGSTQAMEIFLLPLALLAMLIGMSSLYFSYRDCLDPEPADTAAPPATDSIP